MIESTLTAEDGVSCDDVADEQVTGTIDHCERHAKNNDYKMFTYHHVTEACDMYAVPCSAKSNNFEVTTFNVGGRIFFYFLKFIIHISITTFYF